MAWQGATASDGGVTIDLGSMNEAGVTPSTGNADEGIDHGVEVPSVVQVGPGAK